MQPLSGSRSHHGLFHRPGTARPHHPGLVRRIFEQVRRFLHQTWQHCRSGPPGRCRPDASARPSHRHLFQPVFGKVEIKADGDKLVLMAGPKQIPFPLKPWNGPVMVFDFVTENAPDGSRSTLVFGDVSSGPAKSLEIELFSETGPALFERV